MYFVNVTFNASKKGETINRAAGKIISITVFCLKVKRESYKEQREQALGKPVVVLDSSEIWRVQTHSPTHLRNQKGYMLESKCHSQGTHAVGGLTAA